MGIENMQLRHDLKMYPPRVKMTVSMKRSDLAFKLPIKFNGCSDDSQLDIELTFPLGKKMLPYNYKDCYVWFNVCCLVIL